MTDTTDPTTPIPTLPQTYLTAEAAARENIDRPDAASLMQLLALPVKDAGQLVANTTDDANLNLREALPRAARIVNPTVYVTVGSNPPNADALLAAIKSTCPIMRRFAAAQAFILGATFAFPEQLEADGDVVYVPYDAANPANTTVDAPPAIPHVIDTLPIGTVIKLPEVDGQHTTIVLPASVSAATNLPVTFTGNGFVATLERALQWIETEFNKVTKAL